MSECTLHILDAPRIKSQDEALDFIAERVDLAGSRANKKLLGFVQSLLQVYPYHGPDDDSIWYERPDGYVLTGPVLALTFKLSTFDQEALTTLRAIAGEHKLHVFDEEGYVLYLANGREVSRSTSDPFDALKNATSSPYGLRYDGVYVTKMNVGWSYLRFTADGTMYRQGVAISVKPAVAFKQMVEGDPFVGHGKYVVDENGVAGKIKQTNGTFFITARLDGNTLSVSSVRKDGNFRYEASYEFAGF